MSGDTMADEIDQDASSAPRPARSRWRIVGLVALALAVIAGGVFGYRALDHTRVARGHVTEAARLLSEAEPSVIAADAAVRSEITTTLADTASAALQSADAASGLLADAADELDRAGDDLAAADRPLATALAESIGARRTMMREASVILKADNRAATVLESARTAWTLAAEAETLTVDAVAQYNKHTKAGVEQSTVLSKQAATKLGTARSLLETVSAGFPEADMAPFIGYLDARLKLITQSQKIDSTWLAGKVADANKLLDAYNAEEEKVVKQAGALTGTPVSALAAAYDALTKDGIGRYFAARDAAREADASVKTATSGQ